MKKINNDIRLNEIKLKKIVNKLYINYCNYVL